MVHANHLLARVCLEQPCLGILFEGERKLSGEKTSLNIFSELRVGKNVRRGGFDSEATISHGKTLTC